MATQYIPEQKGSKTARMPVRIPIRQYNDVEPDSVRRGNRIYSTLPTNSGGKPAERTPDYLGERAMNIVILYLANSDSAKEIGLKRILVNTLKNYRREVAPANRIPVLDTMAAFLGVSNIVPSVVPSAMETDLFPEDKRMLVL